MRIMGHLSFGELELNKAIKEKIKQSKYMSYLGIQFSKSVEIPMKDNAEVHLTKSRQP